MTNTTYLEWLASEDAKRIAEINGDAPAGTRPIDSGVGKYRLRCLIRDLRRRADELEKLYDNVSDDPGADMGLFELVVAAER